MTFVLPVILCGGSGTRLWPLSRSGFPKQFLALSGDGSNQSLFQQAISRINAISNSQINLGSSLIITNEEHRFLALDQVCELSHMHATFLLEPSGRNTAPALTLAALQAMESKGNGCDDPILVITPADQIIRNDAAFTEALCKCVRVVEADAANKTIVVLGITPKGPETGYGYVQRGSSKGPYGEFSVERFVEKPDSKSAKEYLAQGNYFWNGGMFILRASTWLAAIQEFRRDIFDATEAAWHKRLIDEIENTTFIRPDKELFNSIPSESIDYAVLEHCSSSNFQVKLLELDAGWNDLGAWDAVWQVGTQDSSGNVANGDALLINSKNSLVHSSNRLVSAVGIDNLVIVETADAVLIVDRKNTQDVKKLVEQLELQRRQEKNLHRKVSRPWGWYDNVDEGEGFRVKRIQVKPGASLSLQMHHHRAEHWIIVKGTAEITNGDQVIVLTENQSTYIPQGQVHRLVNPGKTPLEIIEVQSGSYLGEDDIVRLEDTYGRC